MKQAVIDLLAHAGITVNGSSPWDITVHSDQFYKRLLANAELEIGNTYVEGLWDCPALDQFFAKVMRADLEKKILSHPAFWKSALIQKLFEGLRRFFNYQTQKKSAYVGKRHYDIGNDLYSTMLGKNMVYTCGYWENAHNLEAAQEAKLELTCQKLKLKPGMKVLDIGCGWGSFAKYAAENYHVSVVGVTISKAQMHHAQILTKSLPVEIRFQDYRELRHNTEKFDRIVSLGMFEHVGYKNYSTYMNVAAHCLNDDGLFLLHTIGRNTSTTVCASQWINTHIFPNGHIPSITQIGQALENTLVMEDWHNFGTHYDKTLMSWHHNFHAGWDSLKARYGAQFYRLWNYYLLSCAGSFRSRHNQLWQIVLSSKGLSSGYTRVDTLSSPKNIWEPAPL